MATQSSRSSLIEADLNKARRRRLSRLRFLLQALNKVYCPYSALQTVPHSSHKGSSRSVLTWILSWARCTARGAVCLRALSPEAPAIQRDSPSLLRIRERD